MEDIATPISAYLDIHQTIRIAKESGVDTINLGYGFLSESPLFKQVCANTSITFTVPTVESLNTFSDKILSRNIAIAAGVPMVPGSNAIKNADEVNAFINAISLHVIIKAAIYDVREQERWDASGAQSRGHCSFLLIGFKLSACGIWRWIHLYGIVCGASVAH